MFYFTLLMENSETGYGEVKENVVSLPLPILDPNAVANVSGEVQVPLLMEAAASSCKDDYADHKMFHEGRSKFTEDQKFYRAEIQDDGWEIPADMANARLGSARRTLGLLELLFVGPLMGLGIYLVVVLRELPQQWFSLYMYLIASLTADVCVLLLTGALLCACWVCCGEASVRHAATTACIFLTCLQALTCYALAGGGFYFLLRYYDRIREGFPVSFLAYLICETLFTTIYTLKTCPIVCGACLYLREKVRRKIRREPVVVFHRQYRPVFTDEGYVNLNFSFQNQDYQPSDLGRRDLGVLSPELGGSPVGVELAAQTPQPVALEQP